MLRIHTRAEDPVIEVIISGRFGREERTKDGRHQHLCHQVDQLHHHEGLREQRFLSGPKQLKKIAPTPQRRVELYKTSEVVRAKYLLLGVPSATPPIGFRRLPMAGRHRNRLPHSFPRGGGNHPPPPPLHQPHLPPHHLDDLREPPRLPPHHLDDFRDPPRLLPGHPDNFREPLPPHYHFAAHGGGPLPPAPHVVAVLEERLGAEIEEAHALLGQNQRLAATHVALVQEVSAVRHEIGRTARGIAAAQDEGDLRLREVYEWLMKMEAELRAVEEMRAEHAQVRLDIQKLGAARQELMGQVQGFTQDLARSAVDLQQVAALKAEIQQIRHETQHLRSGIELEKKGYAENYEQGQEMQKKLISVASEVEKLRAGVANAEKRSRAAVSAGNQGYGGSFGNPNANYIANPYNAGYSMNQANAGDSGSQYGPGSMHSSWGVYDMQRASGRR